MPAFQTRTLLFPFSRLPSDDPAVERAYGSALICFDGLGTWSIDTIRIYGSQPGEPTRRLDRNSVDFDRVAVALDVSRSEDIEAAINKDLRLGGHMALFAEHLPNDATGRRGPPYARPCFRPRMTPAAPSLNT